MSTPRYGSRLDKPEVTRAPRLVPSQASEMVQLGIITHDRCEEVFALYGQRQYGSQYNYFYEPLKGGAGRVPLCAANDRQLWTGDGIRLPGKKGVWKVTLYTQQVRLS